jgi:uncharacterized protein VirK/YbjX
MPFAWISSTPDANGVNVFLLIWVNTMRFKFISMDALFDNPYDLLTPYYDQFAAAEFYAQAMCRKVIEHCHAIRELLQTDAHESKLTQQA